MAHPRTPAEVKSPAASTPDVWRSFRSEIDRLFDRFALPSWSSFPGFPSVFDTAPNISFNAPAVEITEDDKAYKIAAELPGLDEKDVDVSLSGDVLVLKGEKRQETEEKGKNTYVCERSYGSFQRAFSLPDGIDRNKIGADFNKGVLTVTLPKSAETQQQKKKVEIKSH